MASTTGLCLFGPCSLAHSKRNFEVDEGNPGGLIPRMQTALRLLKTRPPASPGIFARFYGPRAMGAANAGVVAVVQRIIRNVVLVNVTPNHWGRPISQRIDFYQLKLDVPLNLSGIGADRSLV